VAELRVGAGQVGSTERLAMFRQPQRTSARVAVCSSKAPHSRKAHGRAGRRLGPR
jgi:hypothetical protein